MSKTERIRYEMLLRVRDFGMSHRAAFPESSKGGKTFAKVAQAVADIDAHATAKQLAAHEGRRAKAAARTAVRRWMLAIARTARDLIRATPELEATLRMPSRKAEVVLLGSARTFLEGAVRIEDQLVELGLSATFLAEFRGAVDTFENELAGRRSGRGRVAAGRAAIKAALIDGMDAARTLDVVVTNTLGHDPALFARWQRDRRLVDGKAKNPAAVTAPPVSPDVGVATEGLGTSETGSVDAPEQPVPQPLALAPALSSDESLVKAS
jgi:hypothetical protein